MTVQVVKWDVVVGAEVLGESAPQCHFTYHKFHMTWPGPKPGLLLWNHIFLHVFLKESNLFSPPISLRICDYQLRRSSFFELLCTEDPQIICLHKNLHLNEIQILNFVVRHTWICKALWIILPWHSYATSAVHSHGELICNLPTIKHLNSFILHRRESLRSKIVKENLPALYWTWSLINMFSQPLIPVQSQVSSVLTPTYPISSSSPFNIILSAFSFSKWSHPFRLSNRKSECFVHLPCVIHTPSHSPWSDPNNIQWGMYF